MLVLTPHDYDPACMCVVCLREWSAGCGPEKARDVAPTVSVTRLRPTFAFCVWNNHTGQTACLYCGHRLQGLEPMARVCDTTPAQLVDETLNNALGKSEHMERKLREILGIAEETTWGDPAEAFCKIALKVYEALGTTNP